MSLSSRDRGVLDRVLVIGLDGATYDLLVPLVESGKLPNLGRWMARAALGVANSTRPFVTPVAWSTFRAGADPQSHGIFDYRWLDHDHRRLLMNHAGRVQGATIFDAVSESGDEVVSINLPMTYPVAPGTKGIVVGGIDSPSIEVALAPYPDFATRLVRTGARFDLDPIWRDKPSDFADLVRMVDATRDDFHGRVAAARVADEMTSWRLMIVQFQTLDAMQHRAWRLFGVGPGPHGPANWIAKTLEAWQALDEALGELFELAERRGAATLVVSDHGFGPFREKINTPELLARRGLLKAPGFGSQVAYRLERGAWKAKKIFARATRPGRGTAQLSRPLAALLPIDWKKSVMVPLHGALGSMVYANTPERFSKGPLNTPQRREQAIVETTAAFLEARHPDTDEPLFEEVLDLARRHDRDPIESRWPDLVAIPAPGFHTRQHFDPTGRLTRPDSSLEATHRAEGVLMISAPGAQVGAQLQADLRDVAPTILEMLGIPTPDSMSGRVLHEAFANDARDVFDSRPSSPLTPRTGFQPVPNDAGDDHHAVEDRLRALGYVD